ncbi:uncharacterized protein LOC115741224 isoform X2 [Rhodamnia argentea]|uniref:Uncharacterized protein LOC115741224 isoform X2 n=1 Tax=Rhodamnia argentea TaxID=178133 RepID=A0ABM3HU55_9MYRT|nr:uncharacterized protein LOC115741224 isoform X2 [Rhodamnia argentea]
MDESESMVALKKAYAEIILNTAKEAAARVMASERKALRVQHDLKATKEEGLRMLLRLKQMMDAKIAEAEIMSVSQRGRIQELEAQLQEAEDKILDLRVELRSVQDELEKAKKNQIGQNPEELSFPSKDGTPENHVNSFPSIVPYSSDSELETVVPLEDVSLINVARDHKSCNGRKQARQLVDPPLEYDRNQSPDLASIIMARRKEPELYRNGCTQRVRAFEGHMLDRTLVAVETSTAACGLDCKMAVAEKLPGKELNKTSKVPTRRRRGAQLRKYKATSQRPSSSKLMKCSQTSVSDCKSCSRNDSVKSGEVVHSGVSLRAGKVKELKNPLGLQDMLQSNRNYLADGKVLKGKRKKIARGRKCLPDLLTSTTKASILRRCKADQLDADLTSADAWPKETEKGLLTNLDAGLVVGNGDSTLQSRNNGMIFREEEFIDDCESVKKEMSGVEILIFPDGKLDNGMTDVRELNSGGSTQTNNSTPLKYTFQRKRRREPSNHTDEIAAPRKSKGKKKKEDMEDDIGEPKKSDTVNESSRDSRRLAQVARQLIALSGKRW